MGKTSVKQFSFRPNRVLRKKIARIANENGLSQNDVIKLCISAGLNMVQAKLAEITKSENSQGNEEVAG